MQKQGLKFTNEMLMLKFTLNIELVIKLKGFLNLLKYFSKWPFKNKTFRNINFGILFC